MRSLNEAIEAVCRLPVTYHNGGLSPVQIIADSDYRNWRSAIIVQAIHQHLKAHPELLGDWVVYCENKRTSSGWCIDLSALRVYYFERGSTRKEQRFDSQLEACAHYIRHELDSIIR